MASIKCGVFVIALAVFAAQVECSEENPYNYDKPLHKYGGGGGHYAIGFVYEDILQICGTDSDCGACFWHSQNVTDNTRALNTRAAAQCATQYAPSATWTSVCNDYADSMDLSYPNGVPDNAARMLSVCYRTAGEFAAALRCNDKIGGDWSTFYDCFGVRRGGSGHKNGKGSGDGGEGGSNEMPRDSQEDGSRRRRDYSDDFGAVERLIRE